MKNSIIVDVHTVVKLREGEHVAAIGLTATDAAQLRALVVLDGSGMAPKRLSEALKKRLLKMLEPIEQPPLALPASSSDALMPIGVSRVGKRRSK